MPSTLGVGIQKVLSASRLRLPVLKWQHTLHLWRSLGRLVFRRSIRTAKELALLAVRVNFSIGRSSENTRKLDA